MSSAGLYCVAGNWPIVAVVVVGVTLPATNTPNKLAAHSHDWEAQREGNGLRPSKTARHKLLSIFSASGSFRTYWRRLLNAEVSMVWTTISAKERLTGRRRKPLNAFGGGIVDALFTHMNHSSLSIRVTLIYSRQVFSSSAIGHAFLMKSPRIYTWVDECSKQGSLDAVGRSIWR